MKKQLKDLAGSQIQSAVFEYVTKPLAQAIFSLIVGGILSEVLKKFASWLFDSFYSGVEKMNAPEIMKLIIEWIIPVLGIAVIIFVILLLLISLAKKIIRIPNKELPSDIKKDGIDISKSAWQMCELAKEFSEAFRYIPNAFTLDNEKEHQNIFQDRKEIARVFLSRLLEIFRQTQYHFREREELERKLVQLMELFGKYVRTLDLYLDISSQQLRMALPGLPLPYGDLSGIKDELSGKKAGETFSEANQLTTEIIKMLEFYARWGDKPTSWQKSQYDVEEIIQLMDKAIEDVNSYSDGIYPTDQNLSVKLFTADEKNKLAMESWLKYSQYFKKNPLSFSGDVHKLLKKLDNSLRDNISITKLRITTKNFVKLAEEHATNKIEFEKLQNEILDEFRKRS